jgi:rubredoxin
MKIISEREPERKRCKNCNSTYDLEAGDVTAHIDILCGNPTSNDLLAKWECPVCKFTTSAWMYDLPGEWRAPAKKKGGIL